MTRTSGMVTEDNPYEAPQSRFIPEQRSPLRKPLLWLQAFLIFAVADSFVIL